MIKLSRLFVCIALLAVPITARAQWNPQVVDNTGNTGYFTSIAYDASGYPHIAYVDLTTGNIKYASWTGSFWSSEIAATGTWLYSGAITLVLNSTGLPRIAAVQSTGNLYYIQRTASAWSAPELVGTATYSSSDYQQRASLVLPADATPCIAYYNAGQLMYASKSGSSWTTTVVDANPNVGMAPSLAIGPTGYVYIAYYDGSTTGGDLKFAYKTTGGFNNFIVDGTGGAGTDVGQYCSLILDGSSVPHITYYDATNYKLKHAWITNLP